MLSSKMGKDSSCVFLRVSAVSGLVNGAMCRRMLSHSRIFEDRVYLLVVGLEVTRYSLM